MMITNEILTGLCAQNARQNQQGNLKYTNEMMDKIKEREPILFEFISATVKAQVENFCAYMKLGNMHRYALNKEINHIAYMIANAFLVEREIKELEEIL